MDKKILFILVLFITLASSVLGASKPFTLVLDAGHGGKDIGAPGKITNEKTINLKVTLALGKLIEENCSDVRVIYTRKKDVFVTLDGRADIANRNKADLFISIHTNAVESRKPISGMETYTLGNGRSNGKKTNLEVAKRENSVIVMESDYQSHYEGYDPNSPESNIMFEFVQDKNLANSVDLAKMIQKHGCRNASRPDKGVHQANLLVLRCTSMPACLVELGYITTRSEEQLMNTNTFVSKIARGLYNAFVEYRQKYDKTIKVPYKTIEPEEDIPTVADNEYRPTYNPSSTTAPLYTPVVKDGEDAIVFKVQFMSSDVKLNKNSKQFKGLQSFSYYKEGGKYKYTYGEDEDYNKINNLRKDIISKFPDAFVIAFKNGKKMDIREAIRAFRERR